MLEKIVLQKKPGSKQELEFDGKKINTMKKLPNVVAGTEVGKSVELKIWRNKKLISKRLTLGRLETSEEFKEIKPK